MSEESGEEGYVTIPATVAPVKHNEIGIAAGDTSIAYRARGAIITPNIKLIHKQLKEYTQKLEIPSDIKKVG